MSTPDLTVLSNMAARLRRHSVRMTTASASGHPTTCMSAADLISALFFHEMRWDPTDPSAWDVDVFVLSKGHAAPILWAALSEAGAISDDLLTLRQFDSVLEGHPTARSPWVRVATGSLGQGLSAAAGMAKGRKIDGNPGRVFCMMGDGEVAEGSVWEACAFASFYQLDNLCAIVDVNRLGQSDPTMLQHDVETYARRFHAFGWEVKSIDGHDMAAVVEALAAARETKGRPTVLVAKTFKGHGAPSLADKAGWHGKPVPAEDLEAVLAEIGDPAVSIKVPVRRYGVAKPAGGQAVSLQPDFGPGAAIATRVAYGLALKQLGERVPSVVGVDGDTKNSTYSETFKKAFPDRFVECYIAEQNMVGVALGLSSEGKIPFASTFACFLSRAYDFIRMAGYSRPQHLVLTGSHCGVSIGEDGPSQMALEDLAMMRPVFGATVLYPSDGVSAFRAVELAAKTPGIIYIRTTRPKLPVLYANDEPFAVGRAHVLRRSDRDQVTIVGAGVTLHNALAAYDALAKDGIQARVIDLFSVQPVDRETLLTAARETGRLVTVEDHSIYGGLGEAVLHAVGNAAPVRIVGITEIPRSGTPEELMHRYGISAERIVEAVKEVLG